MRSAQFSNHKRSNLTKIVENLNKKKFTTNIDDEVDDERRRDIELSKRKNVLHAEPFWENNSSTITDICR